MTYGFKVHNKDGVLVAGEHFGDLPEGTYHVNGHVEDNGPHTVSVSHRHSTDEDEAEHAKRGGDEAKKAREAREARDKERHGAGEPGTGERSER
jgi:hypothetical protein